MNRPQILANKISTAPIGCVFQYTLKRGKVTVLFSRDERGVVVSVFAPACEDHIFSTATEAARFMLKMERGSQYENAICARAAQS